MCFGKSLAPLLLIPFTGLLVKISKVLSLFSRCVFTEQLLSNQLHLTGQVFLRPKASPWPISLPLPEIFLAGLHVTTMPCDSVIASCAVRGHSRALHKQAVQAVSKRAEERR